MRKGPEITLSTQEEARLRRLSQSNTVSVRLARRAQIVLLAAKLNIDRVQVGRCQTLCVMRDLTL